MLNDSLISLFERDLNRLKDEVNLFKKESDLWVLQGSINNSSGNLCLHICGNLKHFIGATLGNSGYIRERENEFSLKNISKQKLVQNIEETIEIVKLTILKLNKESFSEIFPIDVLGYKMTTEYFLLHLSTHLNYHLGQINYLRRFLTP